MDIQNLERKIKDKRLRIGIEESAKQGIVCGNVLICCIASLNDYINLSKQNQVVYSQRRNYLAKQAKELLHMDVKEIQDKIYRLSPECYPSLVATGRICDMIVDKSMEKVIDNSFVTDKLMRYLSIEEAKAFHSRKEHNQDKAEQRLESFITNDEDFIGICNIFKKDFGIDLTVKMQKEISALMCNEYDFSVILKTLQFNKSEICSSTCKKEFDSTYGKFKYLLTIIESRLADVLECIQQQKKADERLMNMDLSSQSNARASYQRKTTDKSGKYDDLW